VNNWLVGSGSGHGFKHGQAVGEMVAWLLVDHEDTDPIFQLARFQK
jgi:glycine/D-amino acid oxidase-like deaminating enzyme